MPSKHRALEIYAAIVSVAFVSVVLIGAGRPVQNADFDQITVRRINVVEPDGTVRMVISDKAEFPGAYYKGKEFPRPDRDVTGMLFNNEEGTENGGLIFGGKKDADGTTHSWGHLSFDEYERDQTLVFESNSDGTARNTYYGINDMDTPWTLTPEVTAEFLRVRAMPPGPARDAASKAVHAKYPGGIVSRAYFGRDRDKSVSMVLKDQQGKPRLVARVATDGSPQLQFLDSSGKVVRTFDADSK